MVELSRLPVAGDVQVYVKLPEEPLALSCTVGDAQVVVYEDGLTVTVGTTVFWVMLTDPAVIQPLVASVTVY